MDRLVLWDIDRTLVTVGLASRVIYADAFCATTGRDLEQMPDMAGKTDHDLVRSSLILHGIAPTENLVERFYEALVMATQARRSEMRAGGLALPGAAAALLALAERTSV